jgi:hypothetical protein
MDSDFKMSFACQEQGRKNGLQLRLSQKFKLKTQLAARKNSVRARNNLYFGHKFIAIPSTYRPAKRKTGKL